MAQLPPDSVSTEPLAALDLEQLLCRGDIWRGRNVPVGPARVLDSGFADLNLRLVGGGWPEAALIEICQAVHAHAEWHLLLPALQQTQRGLVVLLNPPTKPFAQALLQMGIDLERLVIVETQTKTEFIASFIELARSHACDAVLAWQPMQSLSYTELRKCALAVGEAIGIYVLFRPESVRDQSSPASLRLSVAMGATHLSLTLFKQKGELIPNRTPIELAVPELWGGALPHNQLDSLGKPKPRRASVTPIHGNRSGR